MNKDKKNLSLELKDFLQKCKDKGTKFDGIKKKNPFRIASFNDFYIVTESLEDSVYPSCYAIRFDILLSGIVDAVVNGKTITSTMQYAKEIECSPIYRKANTQNRVGALTKYYYSIHRAFCGKKQKKTNQ